jgi:hypothetical protein
LSVPGVAPERSSGTVMRAHWSGDPGAQELKGPAAAASAEAVAPVAATKKKAIATRRLIITA